MNGFANIESAALQAMDDASDYFEALSDLLHSPEYDPFEPSFFAEVYSDHESEFLGGLRKANAIADARIRSDAMALAQAEKRRQAEAEREIEERNEYD